MYAVDGLVYVVPRRFGMSFGNAVSVSRLRVRLPRLRLGIGTVIASVVSVNVSGLSVKD